MERKSTPVPDKGENKTKRKPEPKEKEASAKKVKQEPRDPSSDMSDTPSTSSTRPKRTEAKLVKDKKIKSTPGEKIKVLIEKFEDLPKKEEKVCVDFILHQIFFPNKILLFHL